MAYTGSTREATKPQITSWSFSKYKQWRTCPLKCKLATIDKLKEPESQPIINGNLAHKAQEDYINGASPEVPEVLKLFADDYRAMREHSLANPGTVFAEFGAAFKENLAPCDWWARDAWLRVKLDVLILNEDNTAFVQDLKTGSKRAEDSEQCELFAMAVFLLHPTVEEVRSELWYSKDGALISAVHVRSNLEHLIAKWREATAPMLADTEFLPLPNKFCGWCHYRKSNGGPCELS